MKKTLALTVVSAVLFLGAHRLSAQPGYTVLHEFGTLPYDGEEPWGGLISDCNKLYGMTSYGPYSGYGTVFSVKPDGTSFWPLHMFNGQTDDGANPGGSLLSDGGKLYGMTSGGGAADYGTIFSMNPFFTGFTLIHSFGVQTDDGMTPFGSLISDGGRLYGMTPYGGAAKGGVIFSLNSDGTAYTLLHSFGVQTDDGAAPFGSLLSDGSRLYGMTRYGGSYYYGGTIFSLNPDGTGYTLLHSFSGLDGAWPAGSLISDGSKLYGMTSIGGQYFYYYGPYFFGGTVFSMNADGTGYTLLHSFNIFDGMMPIGSLVSDGSRLYGTTVYGGSNYYYGYYGGTLFALETAGGGFSVLHDFSLQTDEGYTPGGGSLLMEGGRIYGMTA